jgi:serpin B
MGPGLLFSAAAVLCGCGGSGDAPAGSAPLAGTATPAAVIAAQQAGTAPSPVLVAADNAFGLNLLNSLLPTTAGNVTVSPLSVAMALQIAYNGAAGATQSAMAQTLQLSALSNPALNGDNAALLASLIDADPSVRIIVANSLWMHLDANPVLPAFVQADQTFYGATVGDLSGAPANVNAWVSAETQGLITQILPAADYQQVIAVIANAIYFKGQWTAPFDPGQTAAAPFMHTDGTQVTVQMMHQTGTYPYLQGTSAGVSFQAVRLPYGSGRYSLLVVLPADGSDLGGFVAGITAGSLAGWSGQLHASPGNIALPRFTATFGASLPPALTALGMGAAFCDSPQVDFSRLAANACISDVEHRTVVEVDESGTVAAGATTVTVNPTVVVGGTPFRMTLDHPFFYAVEDDVTGELLFAGVLTQP